MKLQELHESYFNAFDPSKLKDKWDFYDIVKVERDETVGPGTSQQDFIKVPYHVLVELFGEPMRFDDPQADVAFSFPLEVTFYEKGDFDPKNPEENMEKADVEIWTKKFDQEMPDPREIDTWRVNTKNVYSHKHLARELISKGIKATH